MSMPMSLPAAATISMEACQSVQPSGEHAFRLIFSPLNSR
jgi:hypothetical protein